MCVVERMESLMSISFPESEHQEWQFVLCWIRRVLWVLCGFGFGEEGVQNWEKDLGVFGQESAQV